MERFNNLECEVIVVFFDKSWEITADVFGGASRPHTQTDIDRGY